MPPHEREARFQSARVEETLAGDVRRTALAELGLADRSAAPDVYVLRLASRSQEARLKRGEHTWSFLPEADLSNCQHLTVAQFKNRHPRVADRSPIAEWEYRRPLREELTVTILKIDRRSRLLAVQAGELLQVAIEVGALRMDLAPRQRAILDPIALDVFTRKLKDTLESQTGIRNPPLAQARPLFPALGVARVATGRPRRGQVDGPAAEFVWNADAMARAGSGEDAEAILAMAQRIAPDLTERQSNAIEQSAGRRLSLWWGPPGTGKSRTAQAYLAALAANAAGRGASLRVAVVGFTWIAIDNVTRWLPAMLAREGLSDRVRVVRLAPNASWESVDPELRDRLVPMDDLERSSELERRLASRDGITIVASTVDQLYKLNKGGCAPLFDVLLIDEASQLGVAHAVVGLSKLAEGGRVTVVGDDRQMAPIHPLDAPEGLEHLLGSVYDFFRQYRSHQVAGLSIEPVMLDRSFRSNREIVEFVRQAGYGPGLEAAEGNAGFRISTVDPIPIDEPEGWPERLTWSPSLGAILDPEEPLAAIVHNDRFSSQRNDDEADLVASLVLALFRAGLRDVRTGIPYSLEAFFAQGVGVVTPHRAQQAAVFDRLNDVLPPDVDRETVFASVDTVERFQGQEKAVVITSFGLGDADQIGAEEGFLFSLNRFNVAASRAQAKFVAIVSRSLVDHLPRDRQALEESRLLKHFVEGHLTRGEPIDVPGLGRCELRRR